MVDAHLLTLADETLRGGCHWPSRRYAIGNVKYWRNEDSDDRLLGWQQIMTRNAAFLLHLAYTTFWANVFLRMGFMPAAAACYLVGDTVLLTTVRFVHFSTPFFISPHLTLSQIRL
jgi:hypothetical protein